MLLRCTHDHASIVHAAIHRSHFVVYFLLEEYSSGYPVTGRSR